MAVTLEAWLYGNPELIMDGVRARTRRQEAESARKAEIHRKHKSRRIKALVKAAKRGGKIG